MFLAKIRKLSSFLSPFLQPLKSLHIAWACLRNDSQILAAAAVLYVIVTDRGFGFQVSYGPGPCSRKTERAKRARSSCCTDQVRN